MASAFENGKKLLCGDYSSYTPTGKSYFTKNNKFSKVPSKGCIVYFYSGSMGRVSHVGIVADVTVKNAAYTITTIEGNTSSGSGFDRDGGEVAYKTYTFTDKQVGGTNRINGFGYPNFGDDTCTIGEFLEAAMEWLCYIEKASNGTDEQLKNKTWNPGYNNYTWFGKWYGMNGAAWCQMFVSCIAFAACQKHKDAITRGWYKEESDWYYYENGSKVKGKWINDKGRWYALADDGKALTDTWFISDGEWYYLGKDSAMLSSQWFEYKNNWYYLTASGAMAKDAYVKEKEGYCYLNNDGIWDKMYWTLESVDPSKEII